MPYATKPLRISSLYKAQGINKVNVLFSFFQSSLPLHFCFKLKSLPVLPVLTPRAGRWTSNVSAIFLFFVWRSWFTTAVHPHCKYMYLKKKTIPSTIFFWAEQMHIVAPKGKRSLSLQEPYDKPLLYSGTLTWLTPPWAVWHLTWRHVGALALFPLWQSASHRKLDVYTCINFVNKFFFWVHIYRYIYIHIYYFFLLDEGCWD